jgi:hypothetical protein
MSSPSVNPSPPGETIQDVVDQLVGTEQDAKDIIGEAD